MIAPPSPPSFRHLQHRYAQSSSPSPVCQQKLVSWPNFYRFALFSKIFTYFYCCLKVLHIFTVVSKFYIFSLFSRSFKYFHFCLKVLHIFTVFSKFYIFSLVSQSEPWLFCLISLRNMFKQCLVCDARIQMLGPLWRKHEPVASS